MFGVVQIVDAGAGPVVVLLHGIPSPVSYFSPVIEALSVSHRVLCPILPGYAGTPPHPGGYRVSEVTRLLVSELATRGVTELALLGYSYGVYRALALALDGSLRVTKLYLLSGVAGFDDGERAERGQLARVIPDESLDLARAFASMCLPPAYAREHPEVVDELERWVELAPRRVLAAEVEASVLDDDLRPRLPTLRIPTVVRVGELDPGAPPDRSKAIADRMPHASLEVVPGGTHVLLIDDRVATTESIVRFLGS